MHFGDEWGGIAGVKLPIQHGTKMLLLKLKLCHYFPDLKLELLDILVPFCIVEHLENLRCKELNMLAQQELIVTWDFQITTPLRKHLSNCKQISVSLCLRALSDGSRVALRRIEQIATVYYNSTSLLIQFIAMSLLSFAPYPRNKLKQLLAELTSRQVENSAVKLRSLLEANRDQRQRARSLQFRQISQPSFVPPRQNCGQFNKYHSIDIDSEYLPDKIRNNILSPERSYNTQPNIKAGNFPPPVQPVDQKLISLKFEEYNDLINLQDRARQRRHRIKATAVQKYVKMKRTLFQKFAPDKYSFYEEPIKHDSISTIDLSTFKKSSLRPLEVETKETDKDRQEINARSKTIADHPLKKNTTLLEMTQVKSGVDSKQKNMDNFSKRTKIEL